MREVTVTATQMACNWNVEANVARVGRVADWVTHVRHEEAVMKIAR